jgi:hypothetical protein
MFKGLRLEEAVRFADISRIVGHHCLSFLCIFNRPLDGVVEG